MKTKLLKRLRREFGRYYPTPVQDIFYKLCCLKDVKRCYIQSRVRAMRHRRLTATIIQTILCIVVSVSAMIVSFIRHDWTAGIAWFCALVAWWVVFIYEKQA